MSEKEGGKNKQKKKHTAHHPDKQFALNTFLLRTFHWQTPHFILEHVLPAQEASLDKFPGVPHAGITLRRRARNTLLIQNAVFLENTIQQLLPSD